MTARPDREHSPPQYGLGYWLSEDATGHGYATAAVAAVIRHGRTSHAATDVFAGVTHGNHRSTEVLLRLGFQQDTRLDRHTRFHLPLEPTPSHIHRY